MLDYYQAIILAIVQGITEWLPVSSSGHLVLFGHLLGINEQFSYNLLLHVVTMIVVLYIFRAEITKILKAIFTNKNKKDRKLGLGIVIGSIPIAIFGLLLESQIEEAFSNLFVAGIAFGVTGAILYLTRFALKKKDTMRVSDAIFIGFFQALALIPGISRSGSTISAGLLAGYSREEAAKFSFLLFIPAMLGATILKIKDISIASAEIGPVIVGLLLTMTISYYIINILLDIVRKGKFYRFSYYCFGLSLVSLTLFFIN